MSKFRKSDWLCCSIPHRIASSFIRKHHYSKGSSNTSCLAVGLFRKGEIILYGAALWMMPPPAVPKRYGLKQNEIFSLSRLAISPEVPTNGASFLIGFCIRYIRENKKSIKMLITFADQYQSHTGQIYKATNWSPDGETGARYMWIDSDGKMISSYSTKSISSADMDKKYQRLGPFKKYRFIYKL